MRQFSITQKGSLLQNHLQFMYLSIVDIFINLSSLFTFWVKNYLQLRFSHPSAGNPKKAKDSDYLTFISFITATKQIKKLLTRWEGLEFNP